MEKRERLLELDYVRTLTMVGVISIHVSSTFVDLPSAAALPGGLTLARILNQLPICAVPLFLLLSGLSLGLRPDTGGAWAFWRRRLGKLLPPYLGWSLFYWLVFHRGEPLSQLWACLYTGMTVPHLYFIVILLQCYLVYPLLKWALDRWPELTLTAAVLVTLVFRQGIADALAGLGPVSFFLGVPCWELFPTWAGFFVLGMYLAGWGVDRLLDWCRQWAWPLTAMALGYGIWYLYEGLAAHSGSALDVTMLFVTPLCLVVLLGLAGRWKGRPWLDRAMTFGAGRSMTVFYSHIAILQVLRRVPWLMSGSLGMVCLLVVTTAASLVFAWCLDSLLSLAGRGIKQHMDKGRAA